MKTILLLAVLIATPASAQDVLVVGLGGHSCGKWLKARGNPSTRALYQQWIFGFVSGSNWNSTSQARPLDSEALTAFVDSYCTSNPLHALSVAAATVVAETGGPKVQHKWRH